MKINLKIILEKVPKPLKRRQVQAVILGLILLLIILLRGGPDKDQIKTDTVKTQDVISEIIATGRVTSEDDLTLKFAVSGKVVWVPVKEGDYVYNGQAIASLDKEKYEIALRQAEQDVIAEDAELEKLYEGRRNKTSIESYDEKIARTAAEADKNQAYDEWKEAQRNLKDTVLTSPISGTVISFNVHEGQEILSTTEIAEVADTEKIRFTAEVDETEVGKLKDGQSGKILLDAFPDMEIDSEVSSISQKAVNTEGGATAFEVNFKLPKQDGYQPRIGMNGEIRITTDSVSNALTIPSESLVDDDYVWVKSLSGYEKRKIEKGLESDSYIQVLSGLPEGETVLTAGFEEVGKKSLLQKILNLL